MNINQLKSRINQHKKLKWFIHWTILSPKHNSPRLWISIFVNPFYSKRGKGSSIKRNAQLNISPINKFALGKKSIIESHATLDNGVGDIIIGDHTRVGINNTVIGPVTVGNNVLLGQNVILSGLEHRYAQIDIPIRQQGVSTHLIEIADDVWIGANTVITAGTKIGTHCVVAGGSVVTKSIPPFTVVGGNPARILKQYDFDQKEWIAPPKMK